MTEGGTFFKCPKSARALLLSMLLMSGCALPQKPAISTEIAPAKEPLRETQAEAQPSETTTVENQNVVADALTEVDEKSKIFFSLGSSTIHPREREKLRHFSTLLKDNKAMCVTLIGRANDNGSSSFNLAVADARVQSVATALKKSGVKPRQIKRNVIGGEKTPSACQSSECRKRMRRVEIVLSTVE